MILFGKLLVCLRLFPSNFVFYDFLCSHFSSALQNWDTTNKTAQNTNYFRHKLVANGNTKMQCSNIGRIATWSCFLRYLQWMDIHKSNPHVNKNCYDHCRKNINTKKKLNSPSVRCPQKSFNNFHCEKEKCVRFTFLKWCCWN